MDAKQTTPQQERHDAVTTATIEQAQLKLQILEGLEKAAMELVEDFKYMPIGHGDKQAVMLLQYLLPLDGMALFLAQRGWRRHDDLALIKPRQVVGGVFDDLVTYVPVDQPDEPVVMTPEPYDPDRQPSMADLPWSVTPVMNETFEERPDDDD